MLILIWSEPFSLSLSRVSVVSVSVIRSPFHIRNHNNAYITQQTNQLILHLQFSILKSFKPSFSLQIQFKFNPIIHSFLQAQKNSLKHTTQKKKNP